MKKCLLSLAVAGIFVVVSGTTRAGDSAAESKSAKQGHVAEQKPANLERTVKVTMKYLLYLPKDYEQKKSWPVILFLHGSGERGDNLDLVKTHGPPKLIEAGKQFPFIVVSPQCASGQSWTSLTLTALVDEIVERYKVDQDRIYVTGLSMGGGGTWALASYTPNRFAAIVPICGGGDKDMAKQIAHIPAWIFLGGKDPFLKVKDMQEMVDALKKNGGGPKFTIYPEAQHDSWTQAYNMPELYEWLLQQKRTAKPVDSGKK
jgi:predicted peptidase